MKNIDKSRYSVVNINNELSEEEMKENGYVYVPYICVESSEESSKQYDDFMKKYREEHKYCPNCGHDSCSTTLMGYIFNMGKPEEYQDKNRCQCTECGDVHIYHDRLSQKNMKNQFQNDTERIQELKKCLEKSHELLHNAEKMEDVYDMVRTLIRDTLSRYEENEKFLTADVKVEGSFEFLDESKNKIK